MVDDDESDDALEASADDAADANEGRLKRELRKGRLKRDERRDGGAGQERRNARTVAIEVSLPFVENENERGRKERETLGFLGNPGACRHLSC